MTSENPVNTAPVPSVCVRVPHSPSLDSGGKQSDSPTGSPPLRTTGSRLDITTEFATLAVRECVYQKFFGF